MTDKPVKVTLESDDGLTNPIVHECDTIQQAEEWIAERGETDRQRVEDGKYGIDAPEELMDAYATGANGATEVPAEAEKPLNHLANLHETLTKLVVAVQEMGESVTLPANVEDALGTANAVLDDIWAGPDDYANMPDLRQFDEIVSQGREALHDWLENGSPDPDLVDPVRLMDDGRDDIVVPVPLGTHDALKLLRLRSGEIVTAVGFGPASFAVPGLRTLLERVDFASKVPTSDDHEEGTLPFRALRSAAVTFDEFKEMPSTKRAISRATLQLVARGG